MNTLGKTKSYGLIVTVLLILLGCGGVSGDQPPPAGPAQQPVSMSLALSSYAKGAQTDAATQSQGSAVTTQEVEGQLLLVRQDTGETQTLQWALQVDAQHLQIQTEITLQLAPASYDFYFVVTSGDDHYFGKGVGWQVVAGENTVPITLYPLLGTVDMTQEALDSLVEYTFPFDGDLLSAFVDPTFSVAVDGAQDNLFAVNVNTWASQLKVYLPPGDYQVSYRFYDGAVPQVQVPPSPPPPPGNEPPPTNTEPPPGDQGGGDTGEVDYPDQPYVDATLKHRPHQWVDGVKHLDARVLVRIPMLDELTVVPGNPERFLLFLQLGEVRCLYLAGRGEGVMEHYLTNPWCNHGNRTAGATVEADGQIRARVVSADPREEVTTVHVPLELQPAPADDNPEHGQGGHSHGSEHGQGN